MKQAAAILLLILLSFNWVGYRILTSWMERSAISQMQVKLDRDQYNSSELISIKVPVSHLAYYNASQSFEKVDGRVTIAGKTYQYVQRRLWNDSLELICVSNKAVTQIQKSSAEFFKLVNGLQNGREKKQNTHINYKLFLTEFSVPNTDNTSPPVLSYLDTRWHNADSPLIPGASSDSDRPPISDGI